MITVSIMPKSEINFCLLVILAFVHADSAVANDDEMQLTFPGTGALGIGHPRLLSAKLGCILWFESTSR